MKAAVSVRCYQCPCLFTLEKFTPASQRVAGERNALQKIEAKKRIIESEEKFIRKGQAANISKEARHLDSA
jgi:hypothetical protein